ncbi:MAG: DUF3810 domain-containing protein [Oscillospiraceae bacterium]|nr:DUF3810 domain-containing protein [Oscillospiraceae bacterium]
MRSFLRYFRRLHLWLLVNLAFIAAFFICSVRTDWMTLLAERVSMPLERALGRAWALVPFSGAELCYGLAIALAVIYLIVSVVRIVRAEYRLEELYRRFIVAVNVLLSLYVAFCLLWGVNFYAADFCDKSGIYPAPVTQEELLAVTRYFAEQTALCADAVPRDETGAYAAPRQESLALGPTLYEPLYDEFPFLRLDVDPAPKPVYFSTVLSALDTTGFYCPFTGESSLNMDFPAATFPATVAHELAHRRGIASEQQCNFLAVLAATRSDDPAYRYSGWLLGYIHLSNALYGVAPEAWQEIRTALPAGVDADLRAANAYWARYESAVSGASNRAYDAMLKSYGDTLGMRSYGAVVDLLVAYYGGNLLDTDTVQTAESETEQTVEKTKP